MSRHLYKASVKPKLLLTLAKSHANGKREVQVWTTSCIVTNFGKAVLSECSVLINPSNPELSGVRNFPYFPRGGPVPNQVDSMHKDWQPLGYVSQWGGMDVGDGMLFAVSVVDGLVHQLGGWKLRAECDLRNKQATLMGKSSACPIGSAVLTKHACRELAIHYDAIIHATPPFFSHDENPHERLQSCYSSAFSVAADQCQTAERIACPLIGAGARGFPVNVATSIAAKAARDWVHSAPTHNVDQTLAFGLLEKNHAISLSEQIDQLVS